MFKKGGCRKLKKNNFYTKPAISNETKKLLARAIKKYPPLWDLTNENYMKRGVVASCWQKVAQIVNMPISVCKSNWKALRDALSYRTRGKSVKSADGSEQSVEDGEGVSDQGLSSDIEIDAYLQKTLEEWPMWKSLQFLINNRIKRLGSATSLDDDSPPPPSPSSNDEELGNSESLFEQYGEIEILEHEQDDLDLTSRLTEVKTVNCKRKPSDCDYMINKRLREPAVEQLVEVRNVGIPTGYKAQTLKYESIYANLDRMLKKLPESVVEDLNVEFINLTYAEVKKYENSAS